MIDLSVEVARLEHENKRLTDDLAAALALNQRLRSRLSAALAGETRPPGDTTLDSAAHSVLAGRFQDLVAQDLHQILHRHLGVGIARNKPVRLARDVSALCRDLFLRGLSDSAALCLGLGMEPEVCGEQMRNLVGKAVALRTQAQGVDWDFDAVSRRKLDPDRQQAWGQCDPQADVQFVVVPGYRLNDRIYARQQVFTKRSWSFLAE